MAYDTELDFSKLAAFEQNDQPVDSVVPKTIALDGQEQIDLPSNGFTKYADVMKDGADLVLEAPDGTQIIIEGYFSAPNPPLLLAPDGTALTEGLVNSFAKTLGPVKTAQLGSMADESPIGGIKEVTGDVTIIRTSGETIQAKVGTPIYQGDQIETSGNGAANIMFVDETSFAISEEASLVIDEYVFDPSTHDGTTNFSMLRGVFMFTSGLIGKENPQNVDIDTPMGSIGIRGTVIAGDVTNGQVTIVEGAMFIQSRTGERVDLDQIFETARFEPSTGQVNNIGATTAGELGQKFFSINGVAPDLFGVIGQSAQQIGDNSGQQLGGPNGGQPNQQGPQGQNNQQQQQNNEAGAQEGQGPEGEGQQGPVDGQNAEGEGGEGEQLAGEGEGPGDGTEGPDGENLDGQQLDGQDPNQDPNLQQQSPDGTLGDGGDLPPPPPDGSEPPPPDTNFNQTGFEDPNSLGGNDSGFGDGTNPDGTFSDGGPAGDGGFNSDGTLAGDGTLGGNDPNQDPNQQQQQQQQQDQQNSDGTLNITDPPPPPGAIDNLGGNTSGGTTDGNTGGTTGGGTTTPASPDLILNATIAATDGFFLTGLSNQGISVSRLHDFDGDGRDDFAILNDDGAAVIQILQSTTSTLAGTPITTPTASGAQGNVFASIGDFDADGNQDSILGLPSVNSGEGDFQIISGPVNTTISTGAIIDTSGYAPGDGIGDDIAGIGDFNGDGFADVIFGSAVRDSNSLTDNGQAFLMFGGRTNYAADEDVTKLGDPIVDETFAQANITRIRPILGEDLVISVESGSNGFRIIDFDNAAGPTDVTGGVITDASTNGAVDAVFHHGYIYVYGDAANKIAIFDALDPAAPTFVGSIDVSGLSPNGSSRLFIDVPMNKLIFVSNDGTSGKVSSFDLNNPGAPAASGTALDVAGWANHTAVQMVGNKLYVAYGDSIDVRTINTANPSASPAGGTFTDATNGTGITDIKFDAGTNLIYAVSPVDNKLLVIDAMNLGSPAISVTTIANASGLEFFTDSVSGKKLVFVTTNAGNAVEVVDVSTPASPSVIGTITDGASALNGVTNIYLDDGLLFVQSTSGVTTIELIDTIGRVIDGVNNSENLGDNVSSAGDFNNDGFDDFIVTSPGIDGLHIVLGNEDGTVDMTGGAIYLNSINVSASDIEIPVFSLGDINGDGISDIGVVSTGANNSLGAVNILNGGASRNAAADGSLLGASNVTITLSANYASGMLSGRDGIIGGGNAGNFDGDGYDDAVLAVRDGNTIDIFVLDFDAYSGNSVLALDPDIDNQGIFHMQYTMPALYGDIAVDFAVTDFDGDGFDDLLVAFTDPSAAQAGESFVIYGYDYQGVTIQGSAVSASNSGDELVGTTGNDTLDDGGLGLSNLSFRGGDGDDVIEVAGVSQSYSLINAASENTNANNAGAIFALDPDHVFVGNGTALKFFSVDFAGNTLIQRSTNTVGATNVEDIAAQGRFIHVAAGTGGLQGWDFDNNTLGQISVDTTNIANARGVWVDGNEVFVADSSNGIVALTWDGTSYTQVDVQAVSGGTANDVWGNGTSGYIYVAAGDRVEAYNWNGTTLAIADSDTTRNADYVWSDGAGTVYTVSGSTLNAYTFTGATLSYVTSIALQGDGSASAIHGDGQYIYVTTAAGGSSDGIEYFRFDGAALSSTQYVELAGDNQGIYSDGGHLYATAGTSGVTVYNAENIFSDSTFNKYDGGDGIDILRLSANDRALDLSALGSEALSGIEVIEMAGTNQIVQLGIDDIFDLLQNSDDTNTLTINANNDITNQFIISDNENGSPQRPGLQYLLDEGGFTALSSTNIGGINYKQYSFGGYTLNIDEVLVDNGNLQVV